jgi:hypothetical protein
VGLGGIRVQGGLASERGLVTTDSFLIGETAFLRVAHAGDWQCPCRKDMEQQWSM